MTDSHSHPVLLFDGVCNLCNGFVQFVIKRDPEARFRFAALQSDAAQEVMGQLGYTARKDLDTVILIENGKLYTHSDVALKVAGELGGGWPLFGIFWILPKFIRDAIYNWVARNRYRWFGKKEQCMIPSPELRERFLS